MFSSYFIHFQKYKKYDVIMSGRLSQCFVISAQSFKFFFLFQDAVNPENRPTTQNL